MVKTNKEHTALDSKQRLVPSLVEPADSQATCYYFEHILPCFPGHWIDFLPNLFVGTGTPKLLKQAILALAYSYASLDPEGAKFTCPAIDTYTSTTRDLQRLICHQKLSNDDYSLLSVILCMMWEVCWLLKIQINGLMFFLAHPDDQA